MGKKQKKRNVKTFKNRRCRGPQGDGEIRTSGYPSHTSLISAKLQHRAFQKICNFRLFNDEKTEKTANQKITLKLSKIVAGLIRHKGAHGDSELRTSLYSSNLAPISAKLLQRAFRKICNFCFFNAKTFFCKNSDLEIGISSFSVDFGGARLSMVKPSGLHDS